MMTSNTFDHSLLELILPLSSGLPSFLFLPPTLDGVSVSHVEPCHSPSPEMLTSLTQLFSICPCSLGGINQPHSFQYYLCVESFKGFLSPAILAISTVVHTKLLSGMSTRYLKWVRKGKFSPVISSSVSGVRYHFFPLSFLLTRGPPFIPISHMPSLMHQQIILAILSKYIQKVTTSLPIHYWIPNPNHDCLLTLKIAFPDFPASTIENQHDIFVVSPNNAHEASTLWNALSCCCGGH